MTEDDDFIGEGANSATRKEPGIKSVAPPSQPLTSPWPQINSLPYSLVASAALASHCLLCCAHAPCARVWHFHVNCAGGGGAMRGIHFIAAFSGPPRNERTSADGRRRERERDRASLSLWNGALSICWMEFVWFTTTERLGTELAIQYRVSHLDG